MNAQLETSVNILLVDDHPANLLALSAVLSDPNYNLIKVTSGYEALGYLLKIDFAVVILDVMMPGMDGFELAHLMKSRESTRHIPIIFVTAIATDVQYVFKGYSIGAVDYIQKPIEPEIVKAKVSVFADLFRKSEFIRQSERAEFLKREHEGRIRAERAESRFRDLMNSLDHSIIWEANSELSEFSFVSQRAEKLLGYPAEQWISENNFFLAHIPPLDRIEIMNSIYRLRHPSDKSNELGERCEHRLIASDGTERWFHTAIQFYTDSQNHRAGLRGLSVDIQPLKEVEFALRDSQERLEFALRASHLGMWDWNIITGNFIASDTLKWMFGYSVLDFPKTIDAIQQRIHPDDRMKHKEAIDRSMKNNEDFELEYRILLPDGQIRWLAAKGKAFIDSAQRPIRMTGTIQDITDKKEIEERDHFLSEVTFRLSMSLDYNETLRKLANLLVPKLASWCMIDLIENHNIKRAVVLHENPKFSKLAKEFENLPTGLDAPSGASQAIQDGKSVLFPPEKIQDLSDHLQEVSMIGSRDPKQQEIIQTFGMRSYICVLIQIRSIPLGIITLVRSLNRPIFTKKNIKFLEEVARRAALAIDNARLYLEAQKAIKLREDLVSFVSHDLKNPLSAISLNSKLLERTLNSQETREKSDQALNRIMGSTRKMNELINSVLDIAKINNGGFAISPRRENINTLLDEVLELVRLEAQQKSILLRKEIEASDFLVLCDSHQIFRALTNLVSNAIKFTPKGGHVLVSVKPDGNDVLFSISDSGPGIPKDQQAQVFERFWQAKATAHKGTGLGLTIVKKIIEAHHGDIWVDSEEGGGATFHFKLPQTFKTAA